MGSVNLTPLLVVGGVEIGLRLGGYGYPAGFLLHREADG